MLNSYFSNVHFSLADSSIKSIKFKKFQQNKRNYNKQISKQPQIRKISIPQAIKYINNKQWTKEIAAIN